MILVLLAMIALLQMLVQSTLFTFLICLTLCISWYLYEVDFGRPLFKRHELVKRPYKQRIFRETWRLRNYEIQKDIDAGLSKDTIAYIHGVSHKYLEIKFSL